MLGGTVSVGKTGFWLGFGLSVLIGAGLFSPAQANDKAFEDLRFDIGATFKFYSYDLDKGQIIQTERGTVNFITTYKLLELPHNLDIQIGLGVGSAVSVYVSEDLREHSAFGPIVGIRWDDWAGINLWVAHLSGDPSFDEAKARMDDPAEEAFLRHSEGFFNGEDWRFGIMAAIDVEALFDAVAGMWSDGLQEGINEALGPQVKGREIYPGVWRL
jgi:hypothetical protein